MLPRIKRANKTTARLPGGVCVLGLNTNKGQRIDLRLRTDDLQSFRKRQVNRF
jgi:hypothetical protein